MKSPKDFKEAALLLFKYQYEHNPIYRKYINHLNVDANNVNSIVEIPYLPISFFKNHIIKTGSFREDMIFESSGTTGQQRSKHYVADIDFYHGICKEIFSKVYGELDQYCFFALLPSYIERGNSSLVSMAKYFIDNSGDKHSGFYLHNYDELIQEINEVKSHKKIFLIGVSFALLELAENYKPDLNGVTIMETGGMKGRRKELTRSELHDYLCNQFNVTNIHSEYGMTELMSQAYAMRNGKFKTPPWMKVLLRDINDPFEIKEKARSGGINIIDMANVNSCAFIETQDIGSIDDEGYFTVLGRYDNSDVRGCNLMTNF